MSGCSVGTPMGSSKASTIRLQVYRVCCVAERSSSTRSVRSVILRNARLSELHDNARGKRRTWLSLYFTAHHLSLLPTADSVYSLKHEGSHPENISIMSNVFARRYVVRWYPSGENAAPMSLSSSHVNKSAARVYEACERQWGLFGIDE